MVASMLRPLMSQANRIAMGNLDLAQDLAGMAFSNHQQASERGRDLCIGELVVFMKHRGGELRSDRRKPLGSPRSKSADDVFRKKNYLNGDVEILSMDYQKDDSDDKKRRADESGEIAAVSATRDISDTVLFDLGMRQFIRRHSAKVREALMLRLRGFNYREIGEQVGLHPDSVRDKLKEVGQDFVEYFELPCGYLTRYGLSG